MASKGKRTAICANGKVSEDVGPSKESKTLQEYFKMPYHNLDALQPPRVKIDEGKYAMQDFIEKMKRENPTRKLGDALYEYWQTIEAYGSAFSSKTMALMCKAYVTGIQEMGLEGRLESSVGEINISSRYN